MSWIVCLPLLALSAPPATTFRDVTAAAGLELDTGAACWVDLNGDRWPDLCQHGAVWINAGGVFVRHDGAPNVVAADFDNDGRPDLFSWSERRLYRNLDGSTFEPVELPELPPGNSRGACWGDFNGDGFADLYVGGYEDWDNQLTFADFVLLNREGKSFVLAWSNDERRARGVTAADFDEDGDLDVYVSNYRLQPNRLWLNDGRAGFGDAAAECGVTATSEGFAGGHSIGACWGDFDGDGHLDLFAGNFAHVDNRGDQPKSRFYRNLGQESGWHFEDRGTGGIPYQESYATPAAADYDNDGDLDLFFTTVYAVASFGRPNHAMLFRAEAPFAVVDVTAEVGLAEQPPTYQAAWADYDRDGDLDLAAGGKLYQNQGAPGAWLELVLEGDGVRVNHSAVGAQARLLAGDRVITRQVEAGTGEGNQNDLALHFGLGGQREAMRLEIRWPHVAEPQVIEGVLPGGRLEVRFGAAR